MNTWQPIETAPKDGSGVLVYQPDVYESDQILIGWWDSHLKSWLVGEGFQADPTHWMPLPGKP